MPIKRKSIYRWFSPTGGFLLTLAVASLFPPELRSQFVISNNYSQNFDSLGTGLPTGWGTYGQVTTASLGTAVAFTNTNSGATINSWSNTTGAFKNLASAAGLTQTSTVAAQQASLDRVLGIRPTGTFGDVNNNFASMSFNFSTLGVQVTGLGLDAMVLATEGRTKLWDIQYGLGASPIDWTTLATFTSGSDWYTQSYAFTTNNFGSLLDNQSSVWFRFSSTTLSTGSGSRPTVGIDNFSLQVVPEPNTWVLLCLSCALLGILGLWRFRDRSKLKG